MLGATETLVGQAIGKRYAIPSGKHTSCTAQGGSGGFKLGNLQEGLVVASHGWQRKPTNGSKGGWSIGLSICDYLSIYLSACLTIYLPTHPSNHPTIQLSIYLSIYPSIHPSNRPTIHPSICFFIYLSICPSIYLSI